MSSNFRKVRKVELNPQTSGGESFQVSGKARMVGSTRTGSNEQFGISQGASSSISGRELNRDALTAVRDRNQLPARDSAGANQTTRVAGSSLRFGGFGASGSASGSGSSMGSRNNTIEQTSTRTQAGQGGAQVTTNVASGGYTQMGDEMVRTGGRGKLGIYTEKVNVPQETSGERRKIKIETEKVNIPTQPTGGRRKIKIETVKENIPKPVTKGRRVIRIEG